MEVDKGFVPKIICPDQLSWRPGLFGLVWSSHASRAIHSDGRNMIVNTSPRRRPLHSIIRIIVLPLTIKQIHPIDLPHPHLPLMLDQHPTHSVPIGRRQRSKSLILLDRKRYAWPLAEILDTGLARDGEDPSSSFWVREVEAEDVFDGFGVDYGFVSEVECRVSFGRVSYSYRHPPPMLPSIA